MASRKRKLKEESPKRAQQAGSLIAIYIYQHHRRAGRIGKEKEKSQFDTPENLAARWHLVLRDIQQNLNN